MDINAAMTTATVGMINAIGLSATYTPAGGSPVAITVLFDNAYESINLAGGEVGSTGPAVHCKTGDVPNAKHGDAITISGVSYTVLGPPEHDGTGLTILKLKKA